MDSVILFFGNASHAQVEEAAGALGFVNGSVTHGSESVYLQRYGAEDQLAELDRNEVERLSSALGGNPTSAYQVSARHGPAARLALNVVGQLLSKFEPAVLDDDFGNLWSATEVSSLLGNNPEGGIYALRDA
jgi:hypothetical protein